MRKSVLLFVYLIMQLFGKKNFSLYLENVQVDFAPFNDDPNETVFHRLSREVDEEGSTFLDDPINDMRSEFRRATSSKPVFGMLALILFSM